MLTKDKSFYKTLILLAIPISLQYLITSGVNFVDSLMVSTLGDAAISGVSIGSSIQTILQMIIGGIEGAMLVLAAQYRGRQDMQSIRRIASIGLRASAIIGIIAAGLAMLFPAGLARLFNREADVLQAAEVYIRIIGFSYLTFCITQVLIVTMRSVETTFIGFCVSLMSLFVNIGLNYVLIFGKFGIEPMGVRGAAIATLISRILELVVIVCYVAFFDKKLHLKLRDLLQIDSLILRDLTKYGLPILGGQIVWGINLFACASILGRMGKEVFTANNIAGNLFNLSYVAMTGLSTAVGIITGKTVGAGLYDKMKEYARTVQVVFLCVGILTGLMIFCSREAFISLFSGASPGAANYAMQFSLVLSISIVGTCYQATGLAGLVKSGGDTSFVFINDTIFVFLVVIPSALIAMKLNAEPWVVFACLKCDQILKCFVAVVKINRFNWMKNLTRERTDA